MKNLTIISGIEEEKLKKYILEVLDILEIHYKFLFLDELTEYSKLDYIILNSNKKLKFSNLKCNYCFINMDNNYKENLNIYGNIITYGFGNKNTVTLSSVEDNNLGFVYCLQRYLDLKEDYILEPQEIPIHFEYINDIHLYSLMVSVTIALIEGLKAEDIEKKLFKKVLFLK